MRHSIKTGSLTAAATLLLASGAMAQFTEDFEALNLGQLDGQGGWHGWDGINTPFADVVNSQNHTTGGTKSAEIRAGADSVTEFTQFTSGRWIITTWVFAPTAFVGKTYFIVMNSYTDGGPYEWSAQVGFNGDTARLECDCGTAGNVVRPLVTGAWTDLVFDVDLDADNCDVYYNTASEATPIATYPWSQGVFGTNNFLTLQIDTIDLYPDAPGFPHVTPFYFDDISIEAAPGDAGTPICFGDGSGAACGCGTESGVGTGSGCRNSCTPTGGGAGAVLTSSGTASTTAANLTLEVDRVRSLGLFFQANNTIGSGTGVTFGDGIRCCGGSVARVSIETTGGTCPPTTSGTLTTTITTNSLTAGGTGLPLTTGITPGDKRCYQYWYRDPGAANPCGGQLFNLSNAVTVTWGA